MPQEFLILVYTQKTQEHMSTTKICTRMFMVAIIRIAKNWKKPKCPSTREWESNL